MVIISSMSQNNFKTLFKSMLTAIITGIALAIIILIIYSSSTRSYIYNFISTESDTSVTYINIDEPEIVETDFTRLSKSVLYSAKSDFEISEKRDDYAPTASSKKISAKAYYVKNISDDRIILKKNEDTLMPVASIAKLVTAVIARKLLDQNQYIAITPAMANTYGNEARFRVGERLTVEELLYPLLMVSSNDSAEALAMSFPGGRKKFVNEMNNWVNSIGAYRTYFKDPSGLSAQNVSTAKDISIISTWIIENDPDIFKITSTKFTTIRTHTWTNPVHFLNLTSYIGGKNGYTPEANRTGLSIFKLGSKEKIFSVIILGSSMRDNDTLDLLDEAVM